MTPQRYRLVFFDKYAEPAAALVLCHTSDMAARTDAETLLYASHHATVEVWRGTSQLYVAHKSQYGVH